MEAIKIGKQETERKVNKRLNEKLENVPGYEPYSISQSIGAGKYSQSQGDAQAHKQQDIQVILKSKASVDELMRIRE